MLNWISGNGTNLKLAGCLAALVHLSLLTMTLDPIPSEAPSVKQTPLTLVIHKNREPVPIKQASKQAVQVPPVTERERKEEQHIPEPIESSIVDISIAEEKEKIISVPTIHSQSFKSFLNSESDASVQRNPKQIESFRQSFEAPISDYSPEKTSRRTLVKHLSRVGVAMTEDEKGRRTCYGLIQNMLDISAAPSVLSRNCTSSKKFELN